MADERADETPLAQLDPELLERIRRGFPLRLDAMGRFMFEDDEITHPGITALFRAGIDRNDAGQLILRVDEQWTYLNASDCPLRVLQVLGHPPQFPTIVLDDGRQLELDPATLVEDEGGGLRCEVPASASGRLLPARFGNHAALRLSEWMQIQDDGRATMSVAGTRYKIEQVASR